VRCCAPSWTTETTTPTVELHAAAGDSHGFAGRVAPTSEPAAPDFDNAVSTLPGDAMTRSDLVTQLAERFAQLTQRDTEFAVKTILDAMSDALARGHRIEIRGFGSFSINRRPPRMGRNPRSGEQVTIPEKLVPHFKPGKALREAVDRELPVVDPAED
jgi:integration host factor subunit beta